MSELFDALKNFTPAPKKHFVTVEGEKVEVSLKHKLEIIQHGEVNYILKDGKPALKEIKVQRNTFAEIENLTADPFWPEGEFTWKK